MNDIKIRYIKLGVAGCWEAECIKNGTIKFGYEVLHEECLKQDWDTVWEYWYKERKNKGAATRDCNQIRDYYELSENDYFVTFYSGSLWWCQPKGQPFIAPEDKDAGYRTRKTVDGWHSAPRGAENNKDPRFLIQNLDGRITRIQSFQGTICGINIECHNKLLYRILGEIDPEVENAKKSLQEFQQSLLVLVKRLNPKDFELLIELIFSSLGWRRSSLIGGTQKDIDIAFFNPISEKSSYIQIKTQARSLDLQRFVESVCGNYDSDSVYFVYHTGIDEGFSDIKNKYDNLVLWNGERVVELVINAGLIQWVMDRAG